MSLNIMLCDASPISTSTLSVHSIKLLGSSLATLNPCSRVQTNGSGSSRVFQFQSTRDLVDSSDAHVGWSWCHAPPADGPLEKNNANKANQMALPHSSLTTTRALGGWGAHENPETHVPGLDVQFQTSQNVIHRSPGLAKCEGYF